MGEGAEALLASLGLDERERAALRRDLGLDPDAVLVGCFGRVRAQKGVDLLVANEVGVDKTFGQDDTTVHLLTPDGGATTVGPTSKDEAARAVCAAVTPLFG